MAKHNYTQYSNKKKDERKFENDDKPAKVALMEETVDTVTLPNTVEGIVVNCGKLNVRAEPNIDSDIVTVLNVMSEIEINVNESTGKWFKVCTATGIEGYCMRQFVDAYL